MILRAKVPLRISFCGGGTDVAPYCDDHGGSVISSTVSLYGYASLEERRDTLVQIQSLDYDTVVKYDIRKELSLDGKLNLIKAVAIEMGYDHGFNLFIHNDAPPGSGLGSSGAIGVMMVSMFADLMGLRLSRDEIAEKALHVEREVLQIAGGKQDQYSAVYGGFNHMVFRRDRTVVKQLRLAPAIVRELEYHLLLVYTRKTHYSHDLIESQVALYNKGDRNCLQGLSDLKFLTEAITDALAGGRIAEFGDLLHEAWLSKVKSSPLSTTPFVDEVYAEARRLGARGGKILGAGGGGYILVMCPFQRRHIIARRVEEMGCSIANFSFVEEGLEMWHTSKRDLAQAPESYFLEV